MWRRKTAPGAPPPGDRLAPRGLRRPGARLRSAARRLVTGLLCSCSALAERPPARRPPGASGSRARPWLTLVAALGLVPSAGAAQQPAAVQQQPAAVQAPAVDASAAPAPRVDSPYEAYDRGLYDQALQGFTDLQVEYPEDPEVALNVGSAHYQMRNYPEADRAFAAAALASDTSLRAQALYNLGNSAYRQGRLEDAVGLFKATLEITPDDEDAKFNLEFVRDEIRRRHEEAQKRQEQQQPQEQQQQQPPQDQQGDQGEQQQEQQQQQPEPQAQDSDQDGLPDEIERSGENPTDPQDPDSDADGLADGAEDANRNGRLDAGETDPNNPDTDGDGVPDAQESAQAGSSDQAQAGDLEGLTPEEAERYLQALEEGRPARAQPRAGSRRRSDKDW